MWFIIYGVSAHLLKRESHTQTKEAHTAGAYPGFCSTKQLRVLQGYPKKYVAGTHFKDLDEARQNVVKFVV